MTYTTARERSSAAAVSDELLECVRRDDDSALTELYREHADAARRYAAFRYGNAADDLVSGAFEKILGAIRRGAGPRQAFRAYLYTTIRRLAAEWAERRPEDRLDDVADDHPAVLMIDGYEMQIIERHIVGNAFSSLPTRWQIVLWHTVVEGHNPGDLTDTLGMSSNGVAALAYRARHALRDAYDQAHEGSIR